MMNSFCVPLVNRSYKVSVKITLRILWRRWTRINRHSELIYIYLRLIWSGNSIMQILLCKRQRTFCRCLVFTSASKMRIKTDGSLFTSAIPGWSPWSCLSCDVSTLNANLRCDTTAAIDFFKKYGPYDYVGNHVHRMIISKFPAVLASKQTIFPCLTSTNCKFMKNLGSAIFYMICALINK